MRSLSSLFGVGAVLIASSVAVAPVDAQQLEKISIGLTSASLPGGAARIVKQMGLFERHGLDASVAPMDNDTIAVTGLLSGSLEFISSASGTIVVSQARGLDVVGVRAVYSNFAGVLVLARDVAEKLKVSASAPVEERMKALDGLLIATPGPTSSYTAIIAPAFAGGAKVRFTYMAQSAMVAALESGAVQGFVASAPFYAQPVLKNTGVIWISGVKGEFSWAPAGASVLSTTRKIIESRPDLVKKVLAAFTDFSDAVAKRPDEVKAAIAKLFPTLDAPTLDLLYQTGAAGFIGRELTATDLERDIQFTRDSGVPLPQPERLKPEILIYTPK